MNNEELDGLLEVLAEAPDSQIDSTITPRFTALIGKPREEVATELKKILDECAAGSLASDFSMFIMDAAWNEAKGTPRESLMFQPVEDDIHKRLAESEDNE